MNKKAQILTITIIVICFSFLFISNFHSVPSGIGKAVREMADERERNYTPMDRIQIITVSVNKDCQETFAFKQIFISFNGLIGRLLGKNQINEITKLKNGYLSPLMERVEVEVQAENTVHFAESLENEGIPFLFVQAPYLIAPGNGQLPRGLEDYSNADADAYLDILKENGIDTIDIREVLLDSGEDYYSYFFKTDHHWNSEGAFIAYQALVSRLEDLLETEIPAEYKERTSFEEKKYENYFLGANGKRTGLYYNGTDDISILYPKFSTDIQVSIPNEGIVRTGEFTDSVLDWTHMEIKDYYGLNCYHTYIGGEYPLVEMVNENAPAKQKILLVKDSFALPVQAFLSTDFQEIDAIDLRVYQDGTVYDYAMETRPDVVIVFYNPYMLIDEKAYVFE